MLAQRAVWKHKLMAPRVKTFAWRLLRHALPTGARAGRYSTHISTLCARCNLEEDDVHLFFGCSFARAAWYAHPWYIRSDVFLADNQSIVNIIHSIISMQHPHATIPNIFTFLWCLWKARNGVVFSRENTHPHQVHQAAHAISFSLSSQVPCQGDRHPQQAPSTAQESDAPTNIHLQSEGQIMQGSFIKSDMIIAGTKIYSDASWQKKNIPGRGESLATGIGIYIHIPGDGLDRKVMIQASTNAAHSPLFAEALALQFAAKVARRLQLQQVTFFTDNLSLAKMAASRNINDSSITWRCRAPISNFLQDTSPLLDAVYHIHRNINGIAHDCAHQVLNSRIESVVGCTHSSHGNTSCPFMLSLHNFQVEGFVIHAILCC